jgi:hypothetical protein
MTVAVSAALSEGATAVVCASTGNTAASAAAYAARAGLRGLVIVPEGKIATGKLAQALMHGARVIALRGNFDEALRIVRELVERQPMALVNSVNEYRIEGQKTASFELCDQLGEAPDVLCIPVGNAGNITAYWRARCAGRGAGDRGVGDPDRQPGAVGGGDGCRDLLARGDPRGVGRGNPRRLLLARIARGGVLRTGVGGLGGRAPEVRRFWASRLRAHGPRIEGSADRFGTRRPRRAVRRVDRRRRARGAGAVRRHRVVRVPASSANLGPGFDALAAALSFYLELEVEETGLEFVFV